MERYTITHKHSTHVWSANLKTTNEAVIICRSLVDSNLAYDRANALLSAHKRGAIAAKEFFFSDEHIGHVLYAIVPESLETVEDLLDKPLSTETRRNLVLSLFSSISTLHSFGTFHTDIRPDTLAVINNHILLSPLSLSPRPSSSRPPNHLAYLPPEQLLPNPKTNAYPPFDYSTDVWSAAIVSLQLFNTSSPSIPLFSSPGIAEQIAKMFKILGLPSPSDLSSLPPEAARHLVNSVKPTGPPLLPRMLLSYKLPASAVSCFTSALKFCPIKRASCQDVLNSDFLKKRSGVELDTEPSISLPSRPLMTSFSRYSGSNSANRSKIRVKNTGKEVKNRRESIDSTVGSTVSEDEADELLNLFNTNSVPSPSQSFSHGVDQYYSGSEKGWGLSENTVKTVQLHQKEVNRKIDDEGELLTEEEAEEEDGINVSEIVDELLKIAGKIRKSRKFLKKGSEFSDHESTKNDESCESEISIDNSDSADFIQNANLSPIQSLHHSSTSSNSPDLTLDFTSNSLSNHSLSRSFDNSLEICISEIKNFSYSFLKQNSIGELSTIRACISTVVVDSNNSNTNAPSNKSAYFKFKSNLLSDRLSASPNVEAKVPISTFILCDKDREVSLELTLLVNGKVLSAATVCLDALRYLSEGINGWYNLYPSETRKHTSPAGQIHVIVKVLNSLYSSIPPDVPKTATDYDSDGLFQPVFNSPFSEKNYSVDENLVDTEDFVSQYLCESVS
ncbi:hypothetical protein P9112_006775 [Eukaryota sp. TZLM1-RC]